LKPETKFWHQVKKFMPNISFTRLENLSGFGTPDLLCYNKNQHFFTLELKVTKTNSVRLSPHQISFHMRHPNNTFIMVFSERLKSEKLYGGSQVLDLAARGLHLEARCSSLESAYDLFQSL
jgi:hypothetical protein